MDSDLDPCGCCLISLSFAVTFLKETATIAYKQLIYDHKSLRSCLYNEMILCFVNFCFHRREQSCIPNHLCEIEILDLYKENQFIFFLFYQKNVSHQITKQWSAKKIRTVYLFIMESSHHTNAQLEIKKSFICFMSTSLQNPLFARYNFLLSATQ